MNNSHKNDLDNMLVRLVKDLEDTSDIYNGYPYVRTIRNILTGNKGAVVAPFFSKKPYYGVISFMELAEVEKLFDRLVSEKKLTYTYTDRGKKYCSLRV